MRGFTVAMLLVAWSTLQAAMAIAQTAEVTIYTNGSWSSDLHPLSRNAIFNGGIWEDGEPILMFMDKPYLTNDRFVVLELTAGKHVLGIGEGNKPRKGSEFSLMLQPGERYFLRVHGHSDMFSDKKAEYEAVSCQVAHGDLAHGTPLSERAVLKDKRSLRSSRQEVPACL